MFSLFNALSAIRTPGHYNPFFYLFPIASLRHLFRLTLHKFPCLHLRIIFLTRYNPPAFHAKLSWQVSLPIELGYKKKSAAQKVQREGEGIVCSPKFVVCRKRPELAAIGRFAMLEACPLLYCSSTLLESKKSVPFGTLFMLTLIQLLCC